MTLAFNDCDRLFRNDDIGGLAEDPDGVRFLKLRSLNRGGVLQRLFESAGEEMPPGTASVLFRAAFDGGITDDQIEACIRSVFEEERDTRREQEPDLINQLYRLQEFNWGGLHQNSLEKTIVDNYVKKIRNYDRLNEAIEHNLYTSLRGYVLCSWYNHWTSIMIEDVFKDHAKVLPAVGLVKKIDFFIRNVPFDLKVTYLPEGFLIEKRKEANLRPELTLLKQASRQFGIPIPDDLSSAALLQDLWAKVADHPDIACQSTVQDLHRFRNDLVNAVQSDPVELITWLYEEQGIRRFDASNRLFLVLVDQRNYFDSWKLKRARPLLETHIGDYLDGIGDRVGQTINFNYEGESYKAVSDLIVVTNAEATT
jgi:hypothetical protein